MVPRQIDLKNRSDTNFKSLLNNSTSANFVPCIFLGCPLALHMCQQISIHRHSSFDVNATLVDPRCSVTFAFFDCLMSFQIWRRIPPPLCPFLISMQHLIHDATDGPIFMFVKPSSGQPFPRESFCQHGPCQISPWENLLEIRITTKQNKSYMF